MSNFKRILPAAFVAAALIPGGTAMAADDDKKCKPRFDKRALTGAFESGVLTVTPAREGTTFKATTSAKKRVTATVEGAKVTLDVTTLEGETFKVVRLRDGKGQLKLRLEATGTDAENKVQTLTFNTKVKGFTTVCKTKKAKKEKSEKTEKAENNGRGSETDEERETRKDAGEGRGAETEAEREARKS